MEDRCLLAVDISINDVTVDEWSGLATLTVVSDPLGQGESVSVDYTTSNGTATYSVDADVNDYFSALGTLTFDEWNLEQLIDITINDDTVAEGTEYFFVNLANATGANIDDGQGQVTINADEAPGLSNIESYALEYFEGDGPVPVTSQLYIDGQEDVVSAEVTITSGYAGGEDVLAYGGGGVISGSWDAASGTLTLTGTASTWDYEWALQSVTYENASDMPDTAIRTISLTVNDGIVASNTVTRDINVIPVNDEPEAADDSASTDEETPVDIDVLANDTDADGDSLSVSSLDTSGTTGSVSINPDGTIHYDPNGQFDWLAPGDTTTDGFSYTVDDSNGGADTALVEVTINGVNDAPSLYNIETYALEYCENSGPVSITSQLYVDHLDSGDIASAEVTFAAAPFVAIVNSGQKITNQLLVAKWYDAFLVNGNNAAIRQNFIEKDPDKFYVWVRDPAMAGAGKVSIKLSTDSDGADYDDDATETEPPEKQQMPGNFTSKWLMLVSDDTDDNHPVDNIMDDVKNDRTHKIALGGEVKVEYETTTNNFVPGVSFPKTKYVPIDADDLNDAILISNAAGLYTAAHEALHTLQQTDEHFIDNIGKINLQGVTTKIARPSDQTPKQTRRLVFDPQEKKIDASEYAKNP